MAVKNFEMICTCTNRSYSKDNATVDAGLPNGTPIRSGQQMGSI